MKASELRIGNFIVDPSGDVCAVEHIGKDGTIGVSGREYSLSIGFNHINEGFSPIPLTEDWLVRLGFSSEHLDSLNCNFTSGNKYVSVNRFNGVAFKLNINRVIYNGVQLEYVHQLQNLYHALTGTELEVKE